MWGRSVAQCTWSCGGQFYTIKMLIRSHASITVTRTQCFMGIVAFDGSADTYCIPFVCYCLLFRESLRLLRRNQSKKITRDRVLPTVCRVQGNRNDRNSEKRAIAFFSFWGVCIWLRLGRTPSYRCVCVQNKRRCISPKPFIGNIGIKGSSRLTTFKCVVILWSVLDSVHEIFVRSERVLIAAIGRSCADQDEATNFERRWNWEPNLTRAREGSSPHGRPGMLLLIHAHTAEQRLRFEVRVRLSFANAPEHGLCMAARLRLLNEMRNAMSSIPETRISKYTQTHGQAAKAHRSRSFLTFGVSSDSCRLYYCSGKWQRVCFNVKEERGLSERNQSVCCWVHINYIARRRNVRWRARTASHIVEDEQHK